MQPWRFQAVKGTIEPGMTITFSRTFTGRDIDEFAVMTRDYNPCHFEREYCESKGFIGPICHGLLVGSMICEPGGQWGWLATEMNFSFLKPVYMEDTITCTLEITEISERGYARASAVFTNQTGEIVLKAGLAGFLPNSRERKIMEEMIERGDPTNRIA